jgi:hypothetical protein
MSLERTNVPKVILETAPEEMNRTWNVLSAVIKSMETMIKNGGVASIQDGMRAIKLETELMNRYGIDINTQAADTAKRMLSHLVYDIIMPNITAEQGVRIAELIAQDPELAEWVMTESE